MLFLSPFLQEDGGGQDLKIVFKCCNMVGWLVRISDSWGVVPKARKSEIPTVWIPNSLSFGFRHSLDFGRSVFRHSLYLGFFSLRYIKAAKTKNSSFPFFRTNWLYTKSSFSEKIFRFLKSFLFFPQPPGVKVKNYCSC